MRPAILRTLLWKEALRFRHNRGAIVLAVLLLVFALLLAVFGHRSGPAADLGGVHQCYVDSWENGPWTAHLHNAIPAEWKDRKLFVRDVLHRVGPMGEINYGNVEGAIQVRPESGGYAVRVVYPGGDRSVMAQYEAWFWRETARHFRQQALNADHGRTPELAGRLFDPGASTADVWPALLDHLRQSAGTGGIPQVRVETLTIEGEPFDIAQAVSMALVLFSIFFACVYLMPALTCEERERGVLLAQAISPALPSELLLGKFLFYFPLATLLAMTLAGISQPSALRQPFLWLAVPISAFASFGLGSAISAIARTQREASMGSMCYTLAVSMLIIICLQGSIPFLPYLLVEFHMPRMMQAALGGRVMPGHWLHLMATAMLGAGWWWLALRLFRRGRWQ